MIFAEQELALMSLVRIKDLAPGIVLFFRAISLFSGNFLPNAFSFILPDYITGAEAEYNLLPEWSDLNPDIFYFIYLLYIFVYFKINISYYLNLGFTHSRQTVLDKHRKDLHAICSNRSDSRIGTSIRTENRLLQKVFQRNGSESSSSFLHHQLHSSKPFCLYPIKVQRTIPRHILDH